MQVEITKIGTRAHDAQIVIHSQRRRLRLHMVPMSAEERRELSRKLASGHLSERLPAMFQLDVLAAKAILAKLPVWNGQISEWLDSSEPQLQLKAIAYINGLARRFDPLRRPTKTARRTLAA